MITLRKIIYDIRGLIRDAKSDDLHFTDRQIAFWIKTLRARLIKERLDKGQTISSNNYQTFPNVEVEQVSTFTGINNIDLDCTIMRAGKFPNLIEHNGKALLTGIRGLHIYSIIPVMSKPQAIRVKDNKYTKNMIVAFIEDDYIYILGCQSYFENMTFEGVFEDPEAAHKLATGEDMTNDDPYPIDANLIDVIKEIIITKNLSLYLQLPEDRANDAETAY